MSHGRPLVSGTGATIGVSNASLGAQPGSVAVIDDGNSSTADTIDFSAGPHHKSTLTGACTATFVAPAAGVVITWRLIQDATGGRVVTFPGNVVGTPAYDVTPSTGDTTLTFLYDGTDYRYLGTSMPKMIVDIYTTPGNNNWRRHPGLVAVDYNLVSGGAGGGSGAKGPITNNRTGAQGGGSGARSFGRLRAAELSATIGGTQVVVVGDGGSGGATQTTNGSDGKVGIAGGDSSFNGVLARGGVPGAGGLQSGTTTTATTVTINGIAGISNARGDLSGAAGASGNSGAGAGSGSGVSLLCGGAGGGGLTITTNAVANGGVGGSPGTAAQLGGAIGTTGAGQNGGVGPDGVLNTISPGSGGGGGASNATGVAGTGGNGGKYGGGGGGGGASLDSTGDSGAGGNGAQGIVIIVSYF